MPAGSFDAKTSRQDQSARQSTSAPGPDSSAISPPAYGIDAVDNGIIQAMPEHENRTGLPDSLKAGVEQLSGLSMDDVQVHYNSSQPAQLAARAYTQGTDIHVAPGQERHLPHEAWHVVQQKQGRVQPTIQARGVAINDDSALEREASQMGHQAQQVDLAASPTPEALRETTGTPVQKEVVQGIFDWAIDAANARRKVGVEITEANTGGNGISELQPTGTWTAMLQPARDLLWTHTVNLTDDAGNAQVWQVAAANTMVPANFAGTNGNKNDWMRWGSVMMTEDYGDFEWIIRHPNAPMGITHYRDELANVNTARQAVRDALNGLGIGNAFVMALNKNPTLGQVFYINLQAVTAASSQITFESTDQAQTKKALLEGLTHGLNKANVPNRASLVNPDARIATAVTTAANRVAFPDADMELIMAFIIGDLAHKIATLISGLGWGGAVAANFKQWRTLFPKSHPSQLMLQAFNGPSTPNKITALQTVLGLVSADVIDDVTELFAQKLVDRTVRVEWNANTAFTLASDPAGDIFNAVTAGTLPGGGLAGLQAALVVFCTQNGVNLGTEYTNAITALTDTTGAALDVVRSTGFATHAPNTTGFAFEDRAEVQTQFPNLASTYTRIKAIVNRY